MPNTEGAWPPQNGANMNRHLAAAVLVAALLTVPLAMADESEALEDGSVMYCYGDNPILDYEFALRDGMEVRWSAVGESGNPVECTNPVGESTVVRLAGEPYGSRVTVTQSVYLNGTLMDDTRAVLIPLHIGDETYEVVFIDGARELTRAEINHRTLVFEGQDHVIMPAAPVKEGYTFDGRYTDTGFSEEFDPSVPINGDTTVYAKWIGTGSGGSSGSVVTGDNYTVTFQTVTGLEYAVVGQTSGSVIFTVSVVGGYELTEGTLSVTSDRGSISSSGGIYTLTGIDGNTLVTITGDVSQIVSVDPSDDPEGGPVQSSFDGGFPWWILVVIILVLVVLVVALVLRDKRDRD